MIEQLADVDADHARPRLDGPFLLADAQVKAGLLPRLQCPLDDELHLPGTVVGVEVALLADLDPELLAETLRLNFTSVVLLCQAIVPVMAEHGGGKVINISSVAGHNGGAPTTPHYGPAKAAVSNFARTLTKEFGGSNIQVNSVAPGIIDNRFHKDHTSPEMFEKLVSGVPLARAGTNEDVAGAVAFLASPNADYICGDVIHVNGGLYFGQ